MFTRSVRARASILAALLFILALGACTPSSDPLTNESATHGLHDELHGNGGDTNHSLSVHDALDYYVELERATLPELLEMYDGIFSDVSVTAEYPNTVAFSYEYAQHVDPATARTYLETMEPTLRTFCETVVFPTMKSVGVTPNQRATYTYYNVDGSKLVTYVFDS